MHHNHPTTPIPTDVVKAKVKGVLDFGSVYSLNNTIFITHRLSHCALEN